MKYTITKVLTLVSDTFQQVSVKFNNRKDVFIHRILWHYVPDDYSELTEDTRILAFQIGGVSKAAIVGYSTDVNYIYELPVLNKVYEDQGGQDVDVSHYIKGIKQCDKIEFFPSLRINVPENMFIGVHGLFAGVFEIAMLVSEKDLTR